MEHASFFGTWFGKCRAISRIGESALSLFLEFDGRIIPFTKPRCNFAAGVCLPVVILESVWEFWSAISRKWKNVFLYHLIDFLTDSMELSNMSVLSTAPYFHDSLLGYIMVCTYAGLSGIFFSVLTLSGLWHVLNIRTSLLSCHFKASIFWVDENTISPVFDPIWAAFFWSLLLFRRHLSFYNNFICLSRIQKWTSVPIVSVQCMSLI